MKKRTTNQTELFLGDDLPLFSGAAVGTGQTDKLGQELPETPRSSEPAGEQLVAILTEDGKVVHYGDRVYNYYDCEWGTIDAKQSPYKRDGWFDFTSDAGARRILNGARVSTYQPRWAR